MPREYIQPLINFVGGEISPLVAERADLDMLLKSCVRVENFGVLPQGALRKRCGTYNIGLTKNLATAAALIPFQFSADDAIMIVATDTKFRYYRDDAVILNTAVNITALTLANPAQVTANAHGYSNGQEVYIKGVNGTSQVNKRLFLVANVTANTFTLKDQWGTDVNSTAYTAYVSGGTVASVYETTTPYLAADLLFVRSAQVGDVMYLTCRDEVTGNSYPPEKLVRNGFTNWTIGTYVRTNDPFTAVAPLVLAPSGVSQASPGVVTVASTAGLTAGDVLYAQNVGGMTQLNGRFFKVGTVTGTTFQLLDSESTNIDTTGYGAFTPGGTFSRFLTNPACCSFSADGRLVLSTTEQNLEGLWASRTPNGTATRYDDFSLSSDVGSAADPTMGMAFAFSPVDNELDTIREMKQFGANFALLGASSIRLMYGAALNEPASPTGINTLPAIEGSARVQPVVINWDLLFVDVNKKRLRGLQYNLAYSSFQAKDYNLTSDHFGLESDFIKIERVKGTPDTIMCLRADGTLLAFTFNNIENIAGWARIIPASNGHIIDIASIRKSNGVDELWMVVQRTLNSKTYCTLEVMDVYPVFPSKDKFFTSKDAEKDDLAKWANAAWEAGKASTFLDASLTYDGTERGTTASAALTFTVGSPTVAGNTVTITALASVFKAGDVGTQIWKSYNASGVGGGRAVITQYLSATQVQAYIDSPFDVSTAISAGSWSFALKTITNLQIYEGLSLDVQADGGGQPAQTVANGSLTLPVFASKIQVGFGYTSRAILPDPTPNGGRTQVRTIKMMRAKLLESIGGAIGSSPYNTIPMKMNVGSGIQDRVPAPYTGLVELPQLSNWGRDNQRPTIIHNDPTPFTLLYLEPEGLVAQT